MEKALFVAMWEFLQSIFVVSQVVGIAGFFATLIVCILVAKRNSVAGLWLEKHYDFKTIRYKNERKKK